MSILIAKFKQSHREEFGAVDEPTRDAIVLGVRRWMKRNQASLRRVANKAQSSTHDAQVMNDFRDCANFIIEMLKISKSSAGSMDETNVNFSVEAACAYDNAGNKTAPCAGAQSSNRATAALACSLAGEKLAPFLTLKGERTKKGQARKELNKGDGHAKDAKYDAQENAWMGKELMLASIDEVWAPRVEKRQGDFLLMIDQFTAHMTKAVLDKFASLCVLIIFIPAGYAGKL